MLPSETEAGLGAIDIAEIAQENELARRKRRQVYNKWSDEDRYKVGKYASENGAAAAVRKFKGTFKNLNEITVRGFKKRVETELKNAKKEKRNRQVQNAYCIPANYILHTVSCILQNSKCSPS